MTTTPETIAELKRLYAKKGLTEIDRLVLLMSVGGLVTDLEAAQKREQVLREALEHCERWHQGDKWRWREGVESEAWREQRDRIKTALAATEVKP
jgi:hypothetical protein